MKCPQCSFENPPDAKFCGKCGAAMPSPIPVIPTPPPSGEAVSQGLKIGIIVGSVFIPILGIIMGIIFMNDPNPEKKKAGKLWLMVGIGVIVAGCVCWLIMMMMAAAGGGGGY